MADFKNYGVIWDVDGTMLDSDDLHIESWIQLGQDLGITLTRQDLRVASGRRNTEAFRALFGHHYSEEEVRSGAFQKEEYYRAAARKGLKLLPGVQALLDNLQGAGFKQAIGSSAPRPNLELLMELTGIAPYFEAVVGAEDIERGKPDPQVFLAAAEKLGLEPGRCLVLEDAVAGIEAATAARMPSIAVTYGGHFLDNELIIAGAKLLVKSLEDVQVKTIVDLLEASGQ